MSRLQKSIPSLRRLRPLIVAGVAALGVTVAVTTFASGSENEGRLYEVNIDNFEKGESPTEYYLQTDDQKLTKIEDPQKLKVGRQLPPSGSRVKFKGHKEKKKNQLKATGGITAVSEPWRPKPGVKKVAVLLAQFKGEATPIMSADRVRQEIFTDPFSVNAYYREQTFGKITLTGKARPDGDVFGTYKINKPANCSFDSIISQAKDSARQVGVSLTGYDNYLVILPKTQCGGAAGSGTLGGSDVWASGFTETNAPYYRDTKRIPVVIHELGHNFGADHGAGPNCKSKSEVSIYGLSCAVVGYGDLVDPMGHGLYQGSFHMSSFHKGQIGVLNETNTKTVEGPGTFTLSPQEYATPTGTQNLRIVRTPQQASFLSVEYRQPSDGTTVADNDPRYRGVYVRITPKYWQDSLAESSTFSGGWDQVILASRERVAQSPKPFTLKVGESYTDSLSGITVTVSKIEWLSATISVSRGPSQLTGLHHYLNGKTDDHLYTINRNDKNLGKQGYQYKGCVATVLKKGDGNGMFSIEEYENKKKHDHAYTLKNQRKLTASGYRKENISAGSVFSNHEINFSYPGTIGLVSFLDTRSGKHKMAVGAPKKSSVFFNETAFPARCK